jgi:DNA-directed RNA polymerase specialized sigma24 family protein
MPISAPTSAPPTAVTAPTIPPAHTELSVLQLLHREWLRLSACRRSIERVASWGLPVGPVTSLDDVLRHAGFGTLQPGGHADDHVLAILVGLARHDELAGRVVLQRMLPGVVAMARRRTTTPIARAAATDELVATTWTVIRTYPVEHRPDYVAANLLRRVEYEVFRKHTRRRATFAPRPTHLFDDLRAADPPVEPAHELRELLDLAAQRGFPQDELELARRLARGESTTAIAADLGVTDRTVRNRRTNLTTRLAELAAAAA